MELVTAALVRSLFLMIQYDHDDTLNLKSMVNHCLQKQRFWGRLSDTQNHYKVK